MELPPTQHDADYNDLMALLQTPHARLQLQRLSDSAEAQKEAVTLAEDPIGCSNLLRALHAGSADSFIRGVLARRNVDIAAEAERKALYVSVDARVSAVFEAKAEKPWFKG